MSTRTLSFYTLICDGCEKRFGIDIHYASLIEARAAAYVAGWRFPERVRANGDTSKTVSDVCIDCLPTFQRQAANDPWKNRRAPEAPAAGGHR